MPTPVRCLCVLAALVALAGASLAASRPKGAPPIPAKIDLSVAPAQVAPGGTAEVTVRLQPIPGVKINRYPKMKLQVPAKTGVVRAAEVAVGASELPPLDKPDANYYTTVDPVQLSVEVDARAPRGTHRIPAKLTYYYCVAASGFCAPEPVSLTIPITVR